MVDPYVDGWVNQNTISTQRSAGSAAISGQALNPEPLDGLLLGSDLPFVVKVGWAVGEGVGIDSVDFLGLGSDRAWSLWLLDGFGGSGMAS